MPRQFIALSGEIASGKSTAAQDFSSTFAIPVASFGSYVRDQAKAKGLPMDRRSLQDLGASLVESMGLEGLLTAVLESEQLREARVVVLDGVRHVDLVTVIRRHGRALHIHVTTPLADRSARWQDRTNDEGVQFADANSHKIESESTQLAHIADLVIATTRAGVEQGSEAIRAFLADGNADTL